MQVKPRLDISIFQKYSDKALKEGFSISSIYTVLLAKLIYQFLPTLQRTHLFQQTSYSLK